MAIKYTTLNLLILVFGIFLITLPANSQENDLKFRNITIDHGLSNNCITAIHKSSNGFMWIGTTNGLNKYDGYEFKLLKNKANSQSKIDKEIINCLFEDSKENLWIGTMGSGLSRYNERSNTFIHFSEDSLQDKGINSNHIFDIVEDKDGTLWIGGGSGLNHYNPENNTFKHYNYQETEPDGISGDNVFSLALNNDDELWIGTYGDGISVLNLKTDTFKHYNSKNSKLSDDHILDIHRDTDGLIWIATEKGGLNLFNPNTQSFSSFQKQGNTFNFINNSFPVDIKEDKDHRIWISTDRGGLYYYDKKTNEFHYYLNNPSIKESLHSNALSKLLIDDNNLLWTGTYDKGICISNLNQKNLVHITHTDNSSRSISDKNVNCIFQDSKENIWIGTEMGLNVTDSRFSLFEKYVLNDGLSDNVCLTIKEISNGEIWIGTYTGGINIYDPKQKSFKSLRHNPNDSNTISSDFIRSIYEDSQGLMWIGTIRGGVDVYNPQTKQFKNYPNTHNEFIHLTSSNIMSIIEDKNADIWLATYGGGVNIYDRSEDNFIYHKHDANKPNSLSNDQVICQFIDSDGTIWIGTNSGLNKYNAKDSTFSHFFIEDGLPHNSIVGIIEDADKNLWITTANGLSRYNIRNKTFSNYFKEDGLQANVFLYNSSCILKNGKLVFGGTNGLSLLDPKKNGKEKTPPKVYFTDASIFNTRIDAGKSEDGRTIHDGPIHETKELDLKYRDKLFTLNYSTLEYKTSKQVHYQYKIEQLHDDWISLANENSLSFHNLSPDKYILNIRSYSPGTDNYGETNTLKITIRPPLYGNKYFIAFLIILSIIIAWILYRLKNFNARRQKEELQRLVKEKTKALKKAYNELEEHRNNLEVIVDKRTTDLVKAKDKAERADALKTAFLANMSHEIRTPMNAILGFVQLLNIPGNSEEDNDYYRELVQSNSLTLLSLIDDIMDLARIESGNFTIKKQDFNFTNEINDICAIYSEKIISQNPQVKFVFNNEGEALNIHTDPLRLKQIIVNLINNAQKFTEKGQIVVNYKINDAGQLICSVQDSGIGIPAHEIKNIFSRFRKLDGGSEKIYRGTGLGLAITRELVKLLGGEIWVESEVGLGSTFFFTVDIKK
ncbi:two-component regulator propeller domain-containing protein [Carboxylicivirga sp. N1Y90]|uniref:ligand-binding sensor domain-containing protein n=1 Tax=Carboxylicivirga fragile TaxID=3417571 RepID=UPI003D356214|nr:hypothetical protein [Marinilabiliaceae bacterium N1Y90]